MYSTKIMQFRDQTRPFCKDPVYSRFLLRALTFYSKMVLRLLQKWYFCITFRLYNVDLPMAITIYTGSRIGHQISDEVK